jgi:flagellar biogenesis protein FliO
MKEQRMQINYQGNNKISNIFKKINKKWLYISIFFFVALIGFIYFYYNSGSSSTVSQGMKSSGNSKVVNTSAASDLAVSNNQLLNDINNELTQSGQTGQAAASQAQPAAGSGIYSFLKVILGLAVIVILIYLTVFLLRFVNKNRVNSGGIRLKAGKNLIKVLDSANISTNKSIQLVSVAGKMIIIGVTDNMISFLSEVAPGKTKDVDEFLQDTPDEEPVKTNFKSMLANYFKK